MSKKGIKFVSAFVMVVFVSLIALAGCGGSKQESKPAASQPASSQASQASQPAKESKKVTIKVGHVGAPVSPQEDIGQMFAKYVNEKTKGSVEIKLYGSSQLGSEKELQQGVKAGTIDGLIAGSWENFIAWSGILQTPLIYRDFDHFNKVFTGPVGQELMATIEKELGVKPLFVAPHGSFRYITTSTKPIKTPDDMKGLKLRDPNVPAYSIVTKAMGANPVPMDFAELYVALDRKVVDGQHNPLSHVVGSKFYEVQKYLSFVPYGIAPHTVSLSKNAWDKLDPDQQKAVLEAAKQTALDYPAFAEKGNKELLDQLKGKMEIIPADQIDLAAFMKIFNEKALPDLNKAYGEQGAKFLKAILETK